MSFRFLILWFLEAIQNGAHAWDLNKFFTLCNMSSPFIAESVKPYRTPPSCNIQSSATQKCCGLVFFFFFCIIFFTILFFFNWNIRYFACWILSLITASTEMWYPKIWIRCWDWLLLNGHLLYGSTPCWMLTSGWDSLDQPLVEVVSTL